MYGTTVSRTASRSVVSSASAHRISGEALQKLVVLSMKDMKTSTAALELAFKNGDPTTQIINRLHQTSVVLGAVLKEALEVAELGHS